ncbi:MAG TPA: fatty acid desaturase [Polyangiales bacterium]|nr:fatty acid desaturase [Polyangiales bacterium]
MHSDSKALPLSNPRAIGLHLWAFVLPLITLVYWLTAPHVWWASLLWISPIVILVMIDNHAPDDARQPREDIPAWPFNIQVYVLVALQIVNHVLLGVTASKLDLSTTAGVIDAAAAFIPVMVLTGVNAGYSGIVVAHELVHRRNPLEFFLGRLLLIGVMYEHFATEHVRGHHPRVGTRADGATARFGETHRVFMRRTIPQQFKSAWKLEKVRLGDAKMKWYDRRMVRHRVLQGVVAEVGLLIAYLLIWGPLAAALFFVQARSAVLMLETVNYIEHWGLGREGKKVESIDSWDTANWFTLYTLVGLSRHADHHAQASRPYQKLRHFDETAKMPLGYYGTIVLALFRNERYMELATAELKTKKLGPFRDPSVRPSSDAHVHPSLRPPRGDAGPEPLAL